MEQNIKILSDIESELNQILEQILQKKNKANVSGIEVEWLKSRLIGVFDLSLKLNISIQSDNKIIEVATDRAEPEKTISVDVQEIKIEELAKASKIEKKKVEAKRYDKEDLQEFLKNNNPIQSSDLLESSIKTDAVNLIEKADLKILAEKFKTSGKTLYETMGEQVQPQKGLHDKIQASAMKSISQGIGINDKFLFVKELFKGDSEAFQITLNNLDKAESFDEIYSYLKSNFDWDAESEHVQRLLGIAKRKFSLDK